MACSLTPNIIKREEDTAQALNAIAMICASCWTAILLFTIVWCCNAFVVKDITTTCLATSNIRKSGAILVANELGGYAGGEDGLSRPKVKRKRKRNKYENFSKVKDGTMDPLEILLAETERKNKELQIQNEEKPKPDRLPSNIAPLQEIEYPDTKEIDPYDPTTFGYIEIGSVIGAHGVAGLVKVRCTTDFPEERLCTAGIRHLKPAKKRAPRKVVLLSGRKRLDDEYLLKLEDVNDRDAASSLRGAVLYVREEQKVQPKPEEYLVPELVGLDVFLADSNAFIGAIQGIVLAEDLCSVPGLGHDYLEISLPHGPGNMPSFRDELVLVPLVPQIVTKVDIEENAITIDPPTGLLDLKYAREEKIRIKGFLPPAD